MARIGVDYEKIKQTAIKLLSQGIAPSVQKIREELGTGSNTTIAEHLKVWRDEYAKKTIHHLPANMPKELISTFEVLWQTAMEHAQNQLTEYKKAVEDEREIVLQKEKNAEITISDFQLKLDRISCALEQEIANKQKIIIELAITNDRLIKQEEIFVEQKNQYEGRLKQIYNEKDNLITEGHRLQIEIKTLHEKLASQAEEHKRLLAQQHSLQEQSEMRWLNLIDQARLETKEARKKLENIRQYHEEQYKRIELKLINTQKDNHEKTVQLNLAQECISQHKQELKCLEIEYIKSQAIVLKFQEEQKLNMISSNSKKSRKKAKIEDTTKKTLENESV